MMVYHFSKIISVLCIGFLLVQGRKEALGRVPDEEYALMPPVFHLDDFDRCMLLGENALYCSVTVQLAPIDPNKPSRVWKTIEEVISNKKNYRHDKLRHGVCIYHSCPALAVNVSIYKNNHDLLREDLSKYYSEKYYNLDLISTVTDMHCETQEPYYAIDFYDLMVAGFFLILVLIVAYGSLYEGLARYKAKEEYDKITNSNVGKILSCFSIPKNWNRLKSISDSPDAVALRSLTAVRFYNMFLVIMAHTCMISYASPVANPQFFERITENPGNMLVVNATHPIQTYFLIAGWMLSYYFFLTFEGRKDVKFSYIIVAFINRYIRLTPCVLVVVAFSGTWIYHMDRGPVWDKLVGMEYRHCRKNWWANLLYINNHYDAEHMCVQQTWYLATDTQLFLASFIIVWFMWKHQQRIKLILGGSIFVAILIPGLINYINDYDIVLRQYPEALYTVLLGVPEWHIMHIPAYANAGGYLIGVMYGYLFYTYRNHKFSLGKIQLILWWMFIWVVPLSQIYLGIPFYSDSYQHSRILAAVYQSFSRNLFALGIASALFGVAKGFGWFMRDVMNWLPMQIFGRLSYSAYLIHVALIRMRGGAIRAPIYITPYLIMYQTLGDVAVAYVFALILCLFVEMPVSALQKLLVPQLKSTETKKIGKEKEKKREKEKQTDDESCD